MHLASSDVLVHRSVLPPGEAGVDTTVAKMSELAHSTWGAKSPKIRVLAMNIVNAAKVPPKDYYGEIVAIHHWMLRNIRYFRDPVGQETLADPEQTAFNLRGGDCDDLTTLEMALLGSIGIQSYPVVCGMTPGQFTHVYLHATVPIGNHRRSGEIVPLDPIMRNKPVGWEAPNVKARKTYPRLAIPAGISGASMSGLSGYTTNPSYLDTEDSGASQLLIPDKKACYTYDDGTVSNGTRATVGEEGIDSMMGGKTRVVPSAGDAFSATSPGDAFSATSPGDDGTITESAGQLVPRGFLRNEPSVEEIMAMQPASAARLGPRGPITARRAALSRQTMPKSTATPIQSRQQLMSKGLRAAAVHQIVGQKRYEVPDVQRQLREGRGIMPHTTRFLAKPKIISLRAPPKTNLQRQAQPKTLGDFEALADELAATINATAAAPAITLHAKQQRQQTIALLTKRLTAVEQQVLALRQTLRQHMADGHGGAKGIRSAAVIAQMTSGQPMLTRPTSVTRTAGTNGLAGITDTLMSPYVLVPAAVLALVVGLKLLRRR